MKYLHPFPYVSKCVLERDAQILRPERYCRSYVTR